MTVPASSAVCLSARRRSDAGVCLRPPASAPSYDCAGEPRNVPVMSVTRPDSTGSTLKASLNAAREELRAAIARGAGGRGALERYADRVDALICQLFTDAGPYDGPIAIIALGGYGRRHLCLHSDIDLLLLFGGGIGPAEERFVHRFLNPLWDLGVVVGHQVRDIDDFERLETDNPEFLLALLDARPVAGARSVFERFGAVFHQPDTHAFI